jgi:Replication protein
MPRELARNPVARRSSATNDAGRGGTPARGSASLLRHAEAERARTSPDRPLIPTSDHRRGSGGAIGPKAGEMAPHRGARSHEREEIDASPAAPIGAALGNNNELCDPSASGRDVRRALYELRDQLRPFAPKRCQRCGIARLPEWGPLDAGVARRRVGRVDVLTRETPNGLRAHFHGTIRCASPFICPPCSAQLRRDRARDVVSCVNWWRGEDGNVELLTLTLRHSLGDDLRELNRARQRAWRALTAGKPWKALAARIGLAHYVRGTDDTHGRHGWHPHFHVLLFTRQPAGLRARARAVRDLRARWQRAVRKALGNAHVPSWRGVDLRACRSDEYVTKLGLEVVSPETKRARRGGLTPWEIAGRTVAGDGDAALLWSGYVRAMRGARQLTWSRGLRAAAALGAAKSDQEIVDAIDNDAPEVHVASIPSEIWDDVASKPGALYAIKRGAEHGGVMGVAVAIGLYRWGLSPPEQGEDPDQLILELALDIAPNGFGATRRVA